MSDLPRPLPPKKEVALALLEESSLFVHLDPRRGSVIVPKGFTSQPQLVLQIGLNMAIAITDLKLDEEGVSCTLSFNRSPFWCSLPWSAVYALVGEDGRGMVWPEDVPAEVAQQMQKQGPASAKAPPSRKPRGRLAAVEAEEEPAVSSRLETTTGSEPQAASGAEPRRVGGKRRSRDEARASEKESKRAAEAATPAPRAPRALRNVADDAEKAAPTAARPTPIGAVGGAEQRPSSSPAIAGKKPKRELPPYLRVIK